jgi:hypothetical protein
MSVRYSSPAILACRLRKFIAATPAAILNASANHGFEKFRTAVPPVPRQMQTFQQRGSGQIPVQLSDGLSNRGLYFLSPE